MARAIFAKEVYSTSVSQPAETKGETVTEEETVEPVAKAEEVKEEKPEETVAPEEKAEEVKEQPIVNVVADVSVEELYEGVFSIMNKIPAGFAVLDFTMTWEPG